MKTAYLTLKEANELQHNLTGLLLSLLVVHAYTGRDVLTSFGCYLLLATSFVRLVLSDGLWNYPARVLAAYRAAKTKVREVGL
jgi:hypothetical protein